MWPNTSKRYVKFYLLIILLLQDMIQTGMKHCLNNGLNLAQIHVMLGKGHDKHSSLCSFGVNKELFLK